MNPVTALLVDDEPRGLSSLQKLLQLNCPEVNILACCQDIEDAAEKIEHLRPQLVFLDIAMPGRNGFDLLRSLDRISFEIIFVTAHNSYMMQAFRFSAVDYLLKPVEDELLAEAVQRAAKRIADKSEGMQLNTFLHNLQQNGAVKKMKLCVPSLRGVKVIEIPDIIYCEASSNYTNFYLANGSTLCASKPIFEYEMLLEDSSFVRVHKSFLVNLEHIKEYIRGEGGSVIMTNNHEVEISRRKKELFIKRMREYYKY
ncbi:LytR/AlgR family response regulator transcription factor [Niabella drilacis]|uniref:Two component transcriptional regulator, LytTR family n=1 Tax=Niabella drilacis (strain DSM 25811 / CCM 8410 / CCUG 62505 / LMG 26954 / E90) TaxID=1285928 RepID=A0A1G7B8G3_NIADE|nr:LytTR family DNA-binding domain-containing protein [Niabella drilacis]SDE23331.1 two component transcriptional regulator, LytTR family [Niabella drilacis]